MPRARLEFKKILPNLKITSHAVDTKYENENEWNTIHLVFKEYNKTLLCILSWNESRHDVAAKDIKSENSKHKEGKKQ